LAKRAPAGNGGKPPGRMIKPSHKDVEILATLLVAYPQISRVTFDPKKKALNMAFLCRGPIGKRARDSICKSYLESLSVYHDIVGNRASVKECSWEKMDDFYSFVAERDVASLTPGELNLTVELIEDKVEVIYASEDAEFPDAAEELGMSARVFLQDMINQVRNLESTRKLVALREGERVLVFDK
jgi:hypothetical protein